MKSANLKRVEQEQLELIRTAVIRIRTRVLAAALAISTGVGVWVITVWLLIRGGDDVGEHLSLLSNYMPGFSVTWTGAFIGLFWGAVYGAVVGFVFARLYNWIVDIRSARTDR